MSVKGRSLRTTYWTRDSGSRLTAYLMRAFWSAGITSILSKYLRTFGQSGVGVQGLTPSRVR
jgi:hypothetical protein